MKLFGEKLKELREEKKLRQTDIAVIFNVRNTTISEWEKGKNEPSLEIVAQLASYFNVTTDYLLGLEREDGTKMNIYNSFNNNNGNIQIGNNNKTKNH